MEAVDHSQQDAGSLAGATALVRALTGMELAYVSRFARGEQVLALVDGDATGTPLRTGLRAPLERTACQRMVDGRLPRAVPDARALPEADGVMTPAGLRAYVGVPLRTPDGALLGSLCALSRTARPALGAEQVAALEALAPLVASHLLLAGVAAREARRAAARLDALRRELRAPAMAIRFLAEDLAAGSVAPAEAAASIGGEVGALVDLLDAPAPEEPSAVAPDRRDEVDLVGLCAATAARLAPAAERIELLLPARPLPARVDAGLVGHAIGTLIDGALQRSGVAPVVVELRAEGPTALVLVHDDAPVAAPAEADDRADAAVAAGIRGLGYGLAAVRAVATAHEGTLTLAARAGGGTTAALRVRRTAGDAAPAAA